MEEKIVEYENVVKLANSSEDPLDSETIKKIGSLIDDLDRTEDPVFRNVCLHLIADLAPSAQALAILEKRKVPQKLVAILEEDDPLIVPHAITFFYRIDQADLQSKYPQVFERIRKAEESIKE